MCVAILAAAMNFPYPLPKLGTLGKPPKWFANYAVEAKHDGQCSIAASTVVHSRCLAATGAEITHTFPEIWARATGAAQARPSARRRDRGSRPARPVAAPTATHSTSTRSSWVMSPASDMAAEGTPPGLAAPATPSCTGRR